MSGVSEHAHQVTIFAWAAIMRRKYPELDLLYAVPNGGKRHIGTAKKLKAEGVRSGVPDIALPVARGGFHSLFIELKAGKGKPTPNQLLWLHNLSEHNNLAVVCVGADAAIRQIEAYLEMT